MIEIESARQEVLQWVSAAVRIPVHDLDLDSPLSEVGLDSNDAVHLVCTVEAVLKTELPEHVMTRVTSLRDILKLMEEHAAPVESPATPAAP